MLRRRKILLVTIFITIIIKIPNIITLLIVKGEDDDLWQSIGGARTQIDLQLDCAAAWWQNCQMMEDYSSWAILLPSTCVLNCHLVPLKRVSNTFILTIQDFILFTITIKSVFILDFDNWRQQTQIFTQGNAVVLLPKCWYTDFGKWTQYVGWGKIRMGWMTVWKWPPLH